LFHVPVLKIATLFSRTAVHREKVWKTMHCKKRLAGIIK
jgi:hypothetical protein